MAGGNQFAGLIGRGKRKSKEKDMFGLHQDTGSLKKKHSRNKDSALTDSNEYKNVQRMVAEVGFTTGKGFSSDVVQNEKMMTEAMGNYYKLLAACEAYIAKPGGLSFSGKARKNKVKEIQAYAQRDLMGIEQTFYAMKGMSVQEQSALEWDDIIHSARMDNLEVEDYFDESINSGNNAKTGELIGKKFKEGFFSPDHIKKFSEAEGVDLKMNAFAYHEENIKQKDVSVNVANRNIATSRVANLIGVGGIVEQAKSVKIHDKKSNITKTGSLMSKARGKDVREGLSKEKKRLAMCRIENAQEREKIAKGKISPTAQKDLSTLQVLDYLCGQGDRHRGNYFAEKDAVTKQYTNIHGIDNDCSFSTGVLFDEILGSTGGLLGGNQHRRAVVDSAGNLVIPHMDEQLAKNILELKTDELVFALKGVIEDPFINYAVQRLELLQKGIRNELNKNGSQIFLKEDKDWNDDTLEDFLAQSYRRKIMTYRKGAEQFKENRSLWQEFDMEQRIGMTMGDNYVAALVDDIMDFDRDRVCYATLDDYIASFVKKTEGKENFVPKEQRAEVAAKKFGVTVERVRKAYKWC